MAVPKTSARTNIFDYDEVDPPHQGGRKDFDRVLEELKAKSDIKELQDEQFKKDQEKEQQAMRKEDERAKLKLQIQAEVMAKVQAEVKAKDVLAKIENEERMKAKVKAAAEAAKLRYQYDDNINFGNDDHIQEDAGCFQAVVESLQSRTLTLEQAVDKIDKRTTEDSNLLRAVAEKVDAIGESVRSLDERYSAFKQDANQNLYRLFKNS